MDTIPGWVNGSEKFAGLKVRLIAALALVQFTIAVSPRDGPNKEVEGCGSMYIRVVYFCRLR